MPRRRIIRGRVDEALRTTAKSAEQERVEQAAGWTHYLAALATRGDLEVLESDRMWR